VPVRPDHHQCPGVTAKSAIAFGNLNIYFRLTSTGFAITKAALWVACV
jgi:hypothetical protein